MMLTDLLATLRELDIHLFLEGQTLKCKAPKHALTDDIKTQLKAKKEELVRVLARTENNNAGSITPMHGDGPAPLSYAQQRLWFLQRLEVDSAVYNIPIALRLSGALNEQALAQSINEIIRRHQSLRSFFVEINGQPVQQHRQVLAVPVERADLTALPDALRESALSALRRRENARPFNLETGPLIRAALLILSNSADAQESVLLVSLHHIVSDGWSSEILTREFAALYQAFSNGKPSPLTELAIQYADFAAWQRRWLDGPVLERQIDYWQKQLGGGADLLELPVDHSRPPVMSYRGALYHFTVPPVLSRQLQAFSRNQEVTLFVGLLAAFNVLLYRYSHQADICIGTPVANRNKLETENLIGFFVNTLVLRGDLSGDPAFTVLLERIGNTVLDAQHYQDLPFEQVVELLRPERSRSYNPLFQVWFTLRNKVKQALEMPGLAVSLVNDETAVAKFDLALHLQEDEQGGLSGAFEYATDLFEPATVARLAEHYLILLQGIVKQPEARLSQLPLLAPMEMHRMLYDWNDTATEYPDNQCLQQPFEAQVEKTAGAPAVVFEGQELSYAELNVRANQLAHYLRARGVGPQVLVGLCVERSLDMLVGLLGILKAGAAYVPVDPHYPGERIAYLLEDTRAPVLLTQKHLLARLPAGAAEIICLDGNDFDASGCAVDNPEALNHPLDPAYIIYTSGSTGKPKGVMVSHRNAVHSTTARFKSYQEPVGAYLLASSFAFDSSVAGIFWTLAQGGCLCLVSEDSAKDPQALARLIRQHRISHVLALPSLYSLLLSYADTHLQSLTTVIVAGESCSNDVVKHHFRALPGVSLFNEYGPTEGTVWSSVYRAGSADVEPPLPIGYPIANARIYLLDQHYLPVPVGVYGEIYIGGEGVTPGYLRRPDLSAEKFIPDPFGAAGGRLYKTGDLARYRPDGAILFAGRIDHQVKIRGFRIELGEIEELLLAEPDIQDAVVIVREDKPGDKRLVAYLVARSGAELPSAELRSRLAAVLPDYMLPSALVVLPAFPLTANGKLNRKVLPAPDMTALATGQYEAPEGEVEIVLAKLWRELLGLEQVSRRDHFFELGGHSLLAVQLVSRVRDELGGEVDLTEFFAEPVLSDFAKIVGAIVKTDSEVIPLADRSLPMPLSWAQQRLWFLDQLDHAAGMAYHIPAGLHLQGPLDKTALQAALDRIVARHEGLRTTFVSLDGQPVQRIAPAGAGFALRFESLSGLPDRQRAAEVAKVAADEAGRAFDLSAGPLIRGCLLHLADDEHVLLITQHHIISDGWSIGVLIKELSTLYAAFRANLPDPLPAPVIQYADYAAWQRQWLQGDKLQAQIDFWRDYLADAPVLLEVPADRPRPPVQSYRGGSIAVTLPSELSTALRGIAQRHGVTLFMVLLGGWSVLMARLSGQYDVVTGTPVANRQRVETESLIGFFVNTLALRVDLQDDPRVAQLLARVKAATVNAYGHQDIPFEQVVETVNPPRSMAHSPIFQTMLALDNIPGGGPLALAGLMLEPIELPYTTTQFDLSLALTDTGAAIAGHLEYAGDLFDVATVMRISAYFKNVLAAMAADQQQYISRLPLIDDDERQKLLTGFNNSTVLYPGPRMIDRLFDMQAGKTPDAVAVCCEDHALTYRELNAKANRLAHYLRAQGIGPEMRVGIGLPRSLDMVVAVLAVLKAGGAYLPLDPDYPVERLAYMLEDSQAAILITQSGLFEALPTGSVRRVELAALEPTIDAYPEYSPRTEACPDNLAYIIYTSGSTNRPKAVMISHASLANAYYAWRDAYQLGDAPRAHLQMASLSFDVCAGDLVRALLSGDQLVICPRALLLDAPALYVLMRRQQVRIAEFVPAVLRHLVRYLEQSGQNLAFMDILVCGSDTWSKDEYNHFRGFCSSHTRLVNSYGLTEATIDSLYYEARDAATDVLAIGRPFANTRAYLLDGHLQPVPIGVAGEMYIGGAGLARGYCNHPGLTAEKFIADPFTGSPGGRLYKTGDLARYLPTGDIEFLGRADTQVKIRGFRVEPAEIEARLAACRGVHEALVIVREDRPGDKRLVAYLTAEEGAELSIPELRLQLAGVLAEYMLPNAFVILPAFPLTPNGKLDRRALPVPDSSAVMSRQYEAPQGVIETALATIWQDLLHVEQVGRADHFFELGGHSLMVVTLIERLRRHGWSLGVQAVFVTPTLAAMAAAIGVNDEASDFKTPANLIPPDCSHITPDMLTLVSLDERAIGGICAGVPGGAANIQDIYPLSPLQEGILFHHLLQTEGDTYLSRTLIIFDERSRLDAFLCALQTVIDRHDILRTAVHWQGLPQPVQVVQRAAPLPVRQLTPASEGGVMEQLMAATDPLHTRMALDCAPLFSATIAVEPESGKWLLALLNHHLVSDHVTLERIIDEIQMLLTGRGEQLPAPLPYRLFIAQTTAVSEAEHEAYFRAQLADITEPTAPFGILNVQSDGSQVGKTTLMLENELARRIAEAARQQGVTPAVLFHVAWAQVLAQCCGRDDVVFGTVLLGRLQGYEGADRMLGMFINTLPIRIALAGGDVRQVVQETYRRLSNLLRHEQASLALAQRGSGVPASLPLFTSLLNYRHSEKSAVHAGDQGFFRDGVEVIEGDEWDNYPISVYVDDLGGDFSITAQSVREIEAERIALYLKVAITELVNALIHNPRQQAGALSILPVSECRQLLGDFNATSTDYPAEYLLHELIEQQVNKSPDRIAVDYAGQCVSYDMLNRRANRVAHYLLTLKPYPDDRVGVFMERSLELMIGLLGILKAGCAYVPLEPSYPAERIVTMLNDSTPVSILTQAALRDRLPRLVADPPVLVLDAEPVLSALALQADSNPDTKVLGLTPRNLAYVIYTSGSTGQPKGVMNQHNGVVNRLCWAQREYRLTDDDCILQKTPFSFDVSVWEFFLPLMAGAKLVLARPSGHQDPHYLADLIVSAGVTTVHFVPSMLQLFLNQAELGRHRLRRVLCSGEALSHTIQSRFLARWPTVELHNLYGPTEAAIDVTSWLCSADRHVGVVPIGRPIANTEMYILNARLQPVPLGVAGELYIGGVGVARGYLNRPELTAERFIPNPFNVASVSSTANRERLYKTGDLGRWLADGSIEFLGRNDFQVKIRGFRIEPGEIEARLLACDGVRDALVIADEDSGGDKRLVAYYIAQPGGDCSVASLRAQLADGLADYMIPSAFVRLTAFPLSPNGKLDRRALPAPDGASVSSRAYEAPQGQTETALARIWQDLLGLRQVGRQDHFFELGGHSLTAVQLISRLRQALGVDIALRELFEQPTLAGFAQRLADVKTARQAAILPADRSGPLPLSWMQQRLWFLDQLDPVAARAYHLPMGLRLTGELNRCALQAAFDRIMARHEALRTRFINVNGQAVQEIASADTGFALGEIDLRVMPAHEQADAVARISADEAGRAFDLSGGPLIRGLLLCLAEDEHVLLVTQHHIISDGWSIGVLIHEFSTLYMAFSRNLPDPLPALPIQYADYAVWQRQWLQGEVLEAQTEFWRNHLKGAPALLELPTDRPRPALQSYRGDSFAITLPAALSAALRQTAQDHGVTLFMLLLGGWSALMARLSGQADVVTGTPVANRQSAQLENLIGFFVNTLALRVDLQDDPTVAQLLARVKATALNAYKYQEIPFEQVVEAVNPPRGMSHSPIFQVLLTLDNTPGEALSLPGLSLSTLTLPSVTSQFDLALSLTDLGDVIAGNFEYAADLFDKTTIERMAGYFQILLDAMTADAALRVSQLPLLSAAEREQLLAGWNKAADYSQPWCLQQLFEARVASNPDAVAVVFEDRCVSYRELNQKANQLAHCLLALGIQPDDRVAICAERGLEMIAGLLAILKAGAAYVPLDPGYPAERLGFMLDDCKPAALLSQSALPLGSPEASALAGRTLLLDGVFETESAFAHYPEHNPDPAALGLTPQHLAYIIYTSGSTGLPKGVMVEHRQVTRLFAATEALFEFKSSDVWTLFHSFAFDFSVWELWGALLYGGRLVVVPYLTSRSPEAFYTLLCRERVTVLNQTPGAFRQLIGAQAQTSLPHALRYVIFGGEALELRTLAPWIERNDPEQVQLVNMYGITEITVHATYRRITRADIQAQRGSVIGRPLPDLRLYILDAQLQPAPLGVIGEIYIGGAGVARGYLNRPELTSERFIDDMFSASVHDKNQLKMSGLIPTKEGK